VAACPDHWEKALDRPPTIEGFLALPEPSLFPPLSRPNRLRKRQALTRTLDMTDRADTDARVKALIEPFNKKGIEVSDATRFAQDLEWDSLTVLDFVANVEDEFDILITMNQQAEIETVGQLVDAVDTLKAA
jgi:acyl carrier protein